MPVTTNSVGVDLISDIRPKNDADHGVVQDQYLIGGFRRVDDLAARDLIPGQRREVGMHVYTIATGETWKLVGGTANSNWELIPQLSGRSKAGILLPVSFTGTPKVASVVFSTPFSTVDYTVAIDIETGGGKSFTWAIQNRTLTGFVVVICASNITGIVRVHWQVQIEGEP